MKRLPTIVVLFLIAFLVVPAITAGVVLAEDPENPDLVWGIFGGGEDIAFWNEVRISPGIVAPGETQTYSI